MSRVVRRELLLLACGWHLCFMHLPARRKTNTDWIDYRNGGKGRRRRRRRSVKKKNPHRCSSSSIFFLPDTSTLLREMGVSLLRTRRRTHYATLCSRPRLYAIINFSWNKRAKDLDVRCSAASRDTNSSASLAQAHQFESPHLHPSPSSSFFNPPCIKRRRRIIIKNNSRPTMNDIINFRLEIFTIKLTFY